MSANNPITGLCVVDKKCNCPPEYLLLERTAEGEEADLWKDGLFRSKVTRYICYTKNVAVSQWNHVVTNIVLVGLKDSVPQGYTAIHETLDTKEQALKKHTLCYKLLPKPATQSAITDIQLMRSNRYKAEQLTNVGEVNGFNLVYKLSPIAQRKVPAPTRQAPAPPVALETSMPLSAPPPIPQRPYADPTSNTAQNAISGVEFKIHDRFCKSTEDPNQDDVNITLKTQSDIDEIFGYDFSLERELMMR